MNHTLVTFLGKSRMTENAGYRKTVYQFPDKTNHETAFFGLALSQYLDPDSTVILGTCSSQWSVLVEHLAEDGTEEDVRLTLLEAEADHAVRQPLLDQLAPLMRKGIGRDAHPRLIPFGQNAEEQYAILDVVAEAVPNGAVSFDLTHGFRHLGMVGFLSAFMLERISNLNVRSLWYGALDMTRDGVTPVLKLDGLIRVRHWIDALDRFDATGDYGVFERLLIDDGVQDNMANLLKDAAFYERTLNVRDAAHKLRAFLPALDDRLDGASGLFQRRLTARLRWANEPDLASQQRLLAYQYLKRDDFVRAAMLGWEAFANRICSAQGVSATDFEERKNAVKIFESNLHTKPPWLRTSYRNLQNIRNSLAHGPGPDNWYRNVLTDRDRLYRELETSFQKLLDSSRSILGW